MKKILITLLLLPFLGSCQSNKNKAEKPKEKTIYSVVKTDAEWQEILTPLSYRVLRKAATERAWSGPLNDNKKRGLMSVLVVKVRSILLKISTTLDQVDPLLIAGTMRTSNMTSIIK